MLRGSDIGNVCARSFATVLLIRMFFPLFQSFSYQSSRYRSHKTAEAALAPQDAPK